MRIFIFLFLFFCFAHADNFFVFGLDYLPSQSEEMRIGIGFENNFRSRWMVGAHAYESVDFMSGGVDVPLYGIIQPYKFGTIAGYGKNGPYAGVLLGLIFGEETVFSITGHYLYSGEYGIRTNFLILL